MEPPKDSEIFNTTEEAEIEVVEEEKDAESVDEIIDAVEEILESESDVDGERKSRSEDAGLAAVLHSSDPHVIETQRRVTAIFGVFDRNNQKIIDVRDVRVVIRSLGLFPMESDVHEIVQAIEESNPQGYVKYERFVPYVVKILLDGERFQPPPSELVQRAFRALDKEKQGTIEPKELRDVLMKQGEKFSSEEVDKFFKFALDPEDNKIHWEVYLQKLNFE